jgi:hypothetical protein
MVVLGVLAWWVSPWFLLPLVGGVVGWIGVCRGEAKREQARLDEAFAKAYEDFPGPKPELQKGSSYGYPSFTVLFETKEDVQRARVTGHTDVFRAWVLKWYGFDGFDIDRGFRTHYRGWIEDSLESFKIDPTGKSWAEQTRGWTTGDSDRPA